MERWKQGKGKGKECDILEEKQEYTRAVQH